VLKSYLFLSTQIQINMEQKKVFYAEVWRTGESHYHELESREYNELGRSIILDLVNDTIHIIELKNRTICYAAIKQSEVEQLISDLKVSFI